MADETGPQERLLTSGEVARMFRVGPRSVTRWADIGLLASVRTPGGHRRFRNGDVPGLPQVRLLTPAEACAATGLPEKALQRLEASGRVEAVRTPGGQRRYLEDSVRALAGELAGRARPPGSQAG